MALFAKLSPPDVGSEIGPPPKARSVSWDCFYHARFEKLIRLAVALARRREGVVFVGKGLF